MARRNTVFETLRKSQTAQAIEELASSDTNRPNPAPRAKGTEEYSRSTSLVGGTSTEIEIPEDDYEAYWDLFRSVPLVREPIRSFASEVIKTGYWVEVPDEANGSDESTSDASDGTSNDTERDGREQLEDWLSECAIIAGLKHKDFSMLVKRAIIQREVKGTVLIEKASDGDSDQLAGFYFIPLNDDLSFQKYPNQNILLSPDEDISNIPGAEKGDYEKTEDGEWGGYVQEIESNGGSSGPGDENNDTQVWTIDEVIKLTRDDDTTDILGTSRLEAVQPRIESLREKLTANDAAIQSVAWKFWLFKFGSEEDPWPEEDVQDFMSNHSRQDFEAGMKQGVTGDVDIQTVSGEVADISNALQFDINWIMSAMPLPKYSLGGFEQYINQFVSRSQETRIEYQIEEARRELEAEFNPAIQQKAVELGVVSEDQKSDVKLHIETPPEEQPVMLPGEDGENVGASGTDFTRPPASSEREAPRNQNIRQERDQPQDPSPEDDWTHPSTGIENASDSARVLSGVDTVEELEESFSEGDIVNVGDEKGAILEKRTEPFDWPKSDDKIEASEDRPVYLVGLGETRGVGLFTGDELEEDEIKVDEDVDPEEDVGEAELGSLYKEMDDPHSKSEIEELISVPNIDGSSGWDSWPPSWKKAKTPARLIFYDMWTSVGASHSGCVRHFRDDVTNPNRFCAATKDEAYGGWTGWREGGG